MKIDQIIPMNIIFPLREDKVLLGIKTRKIGIGKYNGYGGKVDLGETMQESCARELLKESGLLANPKDFIKIAVIDFYVHLPNDTVKLHKCDIFTINKWKGVPKSTLEMHDPKWFPLSNLPYDLMMEDARSWIRQALRGELEWAEFHEYK